MTADVYRCPDHGFVVDGCVDCADDLVLAGDRRERLSKFLSGALRHFPADAGIGLDGAGWTDYADLVAAVEDRYGWATREHVDAVVATDPKGRFERDGERVRAAYGHSVDVDLDPTDGPVPDRLYHGTAPHNRESILDEGLRPMDRQQVHLSGTVEDARAVGQRHASDPVVFVVDAAGMVEDGRRIARRGRETYTTDAVPPAYLSVLDR